MTKNGPLLSPTPGFDALMNGAGLIDVSTRGRIRVTGEDRARLLHAMSTNHIQGMQPSQGVYAFFLNAQGRILADAVILCFEDHFLVDTAAETRESLREHLERYIIADDVTLEDITDQTFALGLEGPKAREIAAAGAMPGPADRFAHIRWGDYTVASIPWAAADGLRVYGPDEDRDSAVELLESAGAIAASDQDAEAARIANFRPRYGVDIDDRTLPQESQLMDAVHFQKGCYLGQEIVERVRSRGHVNRVLMGFRIGPDTAVAPGAKVFFEGKEAGEVTSATAGAGLAFLRAPAARSGSLVEIDGKPAELFSPAV
jgi:folate-binding protein YgfZ